jgi:hypothetical protein
LALVSLPAGVIAGAVTGVVESPSPTKQAENKELHDRTTPLASAMSLQSNNDLWTWLVKRLEEFPPKIAVAAIGGKRGALSSDSDGHRLASGRFGKLEVQVTRVQFARALLSSLESPEYRLKLEVVAVLRDAHSGKEVAKKTYTLWSVPRDIIELLQDRAALFGAELDNGLREAAHAIADDFFLGVETTFRPELSKMLYAKSALGSLLLPHENFTFCWSSNFEKLPEVLLDLGSDTPVVQTGYQLRLWKTDARRGVPRAIHLWQKPLYSASGNWEACHQIQISPEMLSASSYADRDDVLSEWEVDVWLRVNDQFYVHLIDPKRSTLFLQKPDQP